jgi:hypothetical protein
MLAAGFAGFTQIAKDARSAVDAATDCVGVTDEPKDPLILDGAIGQRLVQLRVEPGPRHLEHATHRSDPEFMPVLIDEAALYSGSLAKYRAAFF